MERLDGFQYRMNKIELIKLVRTAADMGPVEAKQIVDKFLEYEMLPQEVKTKLHELKMQVLAGNVTREQITAYFAQ